MSSSSRRPGPITPLAAGRNKGASGTLSVKILQALFKRLPTGKPEFIPVGQHFLDLSEANANVPYINRAVKSHWGKEYCLVSAEGLKFEDCDSTQG